MWSRNLSKTFGKMGEKDFTKAIIVALQDEEVIKGLKAAILGDFHQEIQSLQTCVESLTKQLKEKDTTISHLQDQINQLEQKCDTQEQYSRRNSLRLTGLKEHEHEDIGEVVIDIINNKMKVSPEIKVDDIDRIHRVGPKKTNHQRQVIVKFATYRARQRVFEAKRNLREANAGRSTNMFWNEDLTKKRTTLLWQARQQKKAGKIKDCWSYDGNILVKDRNSKIMPISSANELVNIAS